MFTYEAAPVFTLMEGVVLSRMRTLVGWEDGDGIFAPGGAISNLYGVLMARQRFLPEAKHNGMQGLPVLTVFTSDHSHFSIKRAASLLGLGTNNVVYVSCHSNGKMDVEDLRAKVERS
ncbi:glutamate decarboxylase 1, partial [Aplysia californica]|uniref:Glutamate decarboxylase 1 n=1 Tax=Aplysia californica TaxID=6500 RepID=A0ABM1AEV4_APLCA